MSDGVTLKSVHVEGSQNGDHLIIVTVSIMADNEFEAVGWVVDRLGEDR